MLKRDLIGPLVRLPLRLCSARLARRCAFALAMLARGWELVRRWLGIRWEQARTWRVSTACLRAVRGVFPRNFPGVLKTSSLFLQPDQQLRQCAGRRDLLSILCKDLGHVLVEPFKLIAHREAKVLDLLRDQVIRLLPLVEDPVRRPYGRDPAASGSHRVVCCGRVKSREDACRNVSSGDGELLRCSILAEHSALELGCGCA